MKNKTKALIWEECRVAGSITLACTVMGILVLASFRFFNSDIKLELGLTSDTLIVCGAPLLILFLLIFNSDYKGALHGGFSERILHLPIPTPVPVTISLITRTLFILLATTLIFATTHLIYGEILSYQFIYGITLLYIIVQFLDWARATLSGLVTTLAFLTVTVFAWLFLADDQATL